MEATKVTHPNVDLRFMVHTVGKSAGEIVREYISLRYEGWLDYSRYKCSKQKMDEFSVDLLDDVILNMLQKDEQFLLKLYYKKKVQKGVEYTELDFYVIKSIDINTYSDTAPFRHKNKPIPVNHEVKVERLKIVSEEYFEIDRPAQILKQTKLVKWVFNGLNLTVFERYVFEQRFFMGETMEELEWHAEMRLKYSLYSDVLTVIHNILYYLDLTKLKPTKELTGRQNELCEQFIKTHKVKTSKSK